MNDDGLKAHEIPDGERTPMMKKERREADGREKVQKRQPSGIT